MKRFLLYSSLFIIFVFFSVWLSILVSSESLPTANGSSHDAELLADKMLKAINKDAYDSIRLIEWSFPRGHRFLWDKEANHVTANWGGNKVSFYPDDLTGTAFVGNTKIEDTEQKNELIQKAWALFANDSFWLVAPYKVREPGTSRAVVETDRGTGLLVTYSSGGVTPGDSYLWILDDIGKPVAWKMWVSILPVKGLTFTWEGDQIHSAAWFAPLHKGPMGYHVDLKIHRVE